MTIFRVTKKIGTILSRHQKIRIFELAVLMVIAGFLEMASVSLIVPFMDAVMNPDSVMSKWYVTKICNLLGFGSHRQFIIFLGVVLAFIYIFKNIFLLLQLRIQKKFVYNNMFMVEQQLLSNFLSRPYEFFLGVNSAEILRIVGNDTAGAFSVLSTLLALFSELVVSGILIATVFVVAPAMTVGMAVLLLVFLFVILKMIRPILKSAGVKYQKALAEMNKWLLQSIQGIKEVKILHKEDFFKENFGVNGWQLMRCQYQNETLALLPKFLLEGVTMSSVFIMISVMIYNGLPLESIIPMLSGIAVAAIRLLPSVNRISQSIASISYNEGMLDKLIENMNNYCVGDTDCYIEESKGLNTDKFNSSIEMRAITYKYPAGEKYVFNDASLTVRKGTAIGIVGASGAGKTTAVDLLLGLLQPESGSVYVDGKRIKLNDAIWLSMVGYIPQTIFMLDGSIRDNVAFGVSKDSVDDELVWETLREAALYDFVKSLPDGLDTMMGERGVRFSGGQRQRVGIARALYRRPAILFFDEATSALDNETENAIMESINELKGERTLIIIAHRLTTIENCDFVYRVEDGKINLEKM